MSAPGGTPADTADLMAAQVEGGFHSSTSRNTEEEALFQEFVRERAAKKAREEQERILRQQREEEERVAATRAEQERLAAETRVREEEKRRAAAEAAAALEAERAKYSNVQLGAARLLLVQACLLAETDLEHLEPPYVGVEQWTVPLRELDPELRAWKLPWETFEQLAAVADKDPSLQDYNLKTHPAVLDELVRLGETYEVWLSQVAKQRFGGGANRFRWDSLMSSVNCKLSSKETFLTPESLAILLSNPANRAVHARNLESQRLAQEEHAAAQKRVQARNEARTAAVPSVLSTAQALGFTITHVTTSTRRQMDVHMWTFTRNAAAAPLSAEEQHTLRKAIGIAKELESGVQSISCA